MNEAQNGATTGSTIASGRFDHALGTIRTFVADGRPPFVTGELRCMAVDPILTLFSSSIRPQRPENCSS